MRAGGRLRAELVTALTLLTRLPVAGAHASPALAVWAFPVAGAVVGLVGAAALAGALAVGCPQVVAAWWGMAAAALVTGALHEDGLADTADGFGGGRDRPRKLLIMRDSRIGSYGAIALLLSLGMRAAALGHAAHPVRAIVLAAVLGRGAMLIPVLLSRPARADGLGALLAGRTVGRVGVGLGLAAVAGVTHPAALLAVVAAGLACSWVSVRQIGGYTGDTLGATEQVAECAVLSLMG